MKERYDKSFRLKWRWHGLVPIRQIDRFAPRKSEFDAILKRASNVGTVALVCMVPVRPIVTDFCSETDYHFYPRLARDWSNA